MDTKEAADDDDMGASDPQTIPPALGRPSSGPSPAKIPPAPQKQIPRLAVPAQDKHATSRGKKSNADDNASVSSVSKNGEQTVEPTTAEGGATIGAIAGGLRSRNVTKVMWAAQEILKKNGGGLRKPKVF